jgi:aconitate hydratase
MPRTLAAQLVETHLVSGEARAGEPIALRIDQALTPDTTGVTVMLELEAMGLDRARTEVAAIYVDHNLLQTDGRSASDHAFLQSAARRFGLWFSPAGNGISHVVHMQRFGAPGRTLVGADSHTPAAGSLGMLAIGVGGLEVALAIAGRPLQLKMPEVWGVRLTGQLPPWVSAKDVILEMLRRHRVTGGLGRIIEYHGPGVATLSAMDRHVIANMGAELGATTSLFPSDLEVRRFLAREGREAEWRELAAEPGAVYDVEDEIDLGRLEPLVALPSSPDNVVPVAEAAGTAISQAYIGSSANPALRDLVVAARMVTGRSVAPGVSFDVNPASRETLSNLIAEQQLEPLISAGARLHQAGCNGCVGMGQAPRPDSASIRTTPRNFPGRTGTVDDRVYLASPETTAASALTGVITDPRTLPALLGIEAPAYREPEAPDYRVSTQNLIPPLDPDEARTVVLAKGGHIASLPEFDPLPERIDGPVLLTLGDGVSTDEILQGGQEVLPLRSDIPSTAEYAFRRVDPGYVARAKAVPMHVVVAGRNLGQGSSREHAVLAPRFLGLRAIIAVDYARIFWRNLVNFGVLPLEFADPADADAISRDDRLVIEGVREAVRGPGPIRVLNATTGQSIDVVHRLDASQLQMVLHGSLLSVVRAELTGAGK